MTTWEHAKNILCIRLDAIGDVLMTTPAIRALKTHDSDRSITLLTSPAGEGIAAFIPEVDRVLCYEAPWMKATATRANSQLEREMVQRLRQQHFDAAVIFTVFSQNPLPAAFLCYLADIPLRLAHCHENPYQLLTDWVLDPEPSAGIRHEVQRQLDLVGTVGCHTENLQLSLQVKERDRQQVWQRLQAMHLNLAKPWVLIHPGATAASRRYSSDSFAVVAQQFMTEHHIPVVFSGSAAERSLIARIQDQMTVNAISLAGELTLSEMVALVAIAPGVISNNTGPVHIAAAVGTPVVDLYALTNPQHTPWQVPHRVLFHDVPCKFCYKSLCPEGHHDCLEKVAPQQVVQAMLALLPAGKQPNLTAQHQPLALTSTAIATGPPTLLSPSPSRSASLSAKHIWR